MRIAGTASSQALTKSEILSCCLREIKVADQETSAMLHACRQGCYFAANAEAFAWAAPAARNFCGFCCTPFTSTSK